MAGFDEWLCERLMNRYMRRNRALGEHVAVYAWDYIGLQVMLHGTYEGVFLDAATAFLKENGIDTGGTYLDIGANIGNHALYFSRHARRVLAFEPNPKVYRLLSLNASGRCIETFNFGLSDANGMLSFEVNAANLGEARVVRAPSVPECAETIEVRRYDDIEALRDVKVDVMKVDVEFHEHAVFTGCREMIARCKPAIIFEQMAEEVSGGTSRTVELLRSYGYRFYYYGHAVDFPKGIRGFGALVMGLLGQRERFRPLVAMRRKAYNIVALPTARPGR